MSNNTQLKTLFPYQQQAVRDIKRAFKAGHNSVLFEMFMGGGKTEIGLTVAKSVGKTLWLAHRKKLVQQAEGRLVDSREVLFNTFQGELSQLRKGNKRVGVKLIVIDEAHRSEAAGYQEILAAYPDAKVLGLTATPIRLDGKSLHTSLGGTYAAKVKGPSIAQLANKYKRIVLPRHYTSPTKMDLSVLKTSGEDYNMTDAGERMANKVLCGGIVEHYSKLASGKQALVMACSVRHANALVEAFNTALGAGFAGKIVSEDKVEADANLQAFEAGLLKVAVQIDMLTEGFDYPKLAVVIFARPTKSLAVFRQGVGRCMRTAPRKGRPLLLDHAGLYHHFGRVQDGEDNEEQGNFGRFAPCRECPACSQIVEIRQAVCDCGFVFAGEASLPVPRADVQFWETREALIEAERVQKAAAKIKRLPQREWPAGFYASARKDGKWKISYSKMSNGKRVDISISTGVATRDTAVAVAVEAHKLLAEGGMEAMLAYKESLRKSSKKGKGGTQLERVRAFRERRANDPEYRAKLAAQERARRARKRSK